MITKRLSALALLTFATLGLAACGSGDAASPGTSPELSDAAKADTAKVAAVAWDEAADGTPMLTFDLPLAVSDASARLIQDGDGALIEDGQVVGLDFVVFSGVDGTLQFSTYESGAPESLVLAQAEVTPALWNALVGSHVGAQLIFATPDASATPTDGVYPCIVMAMIVTSAADVLERAEGQAVAPVAGLPIITLAETGAPSIDLAGVQMPTDLVVQPLIVGSGEPLVIGQTLTVHYTGWLWDGTQFDSSWNRGASASFPFVDGGLIDGWIQGLAGQPVGSQVLLVIPPELGYGEAGTGSIPGGATLVFVVDILAAA